MVALFCRDMFIELMALKQQTSSPAQAVMVAAQAIFRGLTPLSRRSMRRMIIRPITAISRSNNSDGMAYSSAFTTPRTPPMSAPDGLPTKCRCWMRRARALTGVPDPGWELQPVLRQNQHMLGVGCCFRPGGQPWAGRPGAGAAPVLCGGDAAPGSVPAPHGYQTAPRIDRRGFRRRCPRTPSLPSRAGMTCATDCKPSLSTGMRRERHAGPRPGAGTRRCLRHPIARSAPPHLPGCVHTGPVGLLSDSRAPVRIGIQ